MQYLALELHDRAVSVAVDGQVLASAASAVFDGTGAGVAGTHAWSELRLHPRAVSTRHLGAVFTRRGNSARSEALLEAELNSRLSEQPPVKGKRMWIVVPAQAEAAGLAALLGIARRGGLPVDGFVDAATVIAASLNTSPSLNTSQSAIVLELGLHHVAATSVDCHGSQARRRRAVLSDRGGLIELYQAWLELVSTTMVKRTRFDPLHDAATEQQVFESVQALALEAARTGNATARVHKGAGTFETDLTRDQFARAAQPIYRSIVGLLHQLRPAGEPVALVMPQLAAQLPGLREQLEQFVGCELISIPDGFAAAVTSLLDLPEPPSDATGVSLLRRLPLRRQPTADWAVAADLQASDEGPLSRVSREPLGNRRASGPPPSHILWDGRAYGLQTDPLVVGRTQSSDARDITAASASPGTSAITAPGTSAGTSPPTLASTPVSNQGNIRFIALPDGLAGVSRRHCTFVHDGDEMVLLDHSTFGTFVNGERVHERARIYAGDRVRLGEPGVELTLIAVGPQQP